MPLHSSPELERPPELPGALAAQALRASESRYRRLFEASRDGILLLNSKTAQIEDVNPYLIEMLGYSHAEFLGKKLWEVGSFADVAECKEMFAGLQSTGYVEYSDLPLKTKAGARIAVEFVSNAYDCEGVRVIQCNIRNITARNEAYAHIRRQTQLFAALSQCNKAIARCASVDEMLPLICRHAVELGGMTMAWIGFADAATLEVRPAASFGDDTGYLRDIAVTIAAESPFAGGPTGTALREDRPYWCQDFQNDPATLPWRERGRRAGWGASAALPLHRNGVVVGVFALYCATTQCFDESARGLLVEMAADISFALDNFAREAQRKQAEAALVESTQLLETIVDAVPMRVFWKDRDLRYLGCNTALAKDAGFREPGDVIGKDDFQMGWASQAEAYRSDDRKVMASGIPRLSYDEVQTTPEGRQMWLRTSKVPIRGRGNETIGVLGTYEDITERKLAEWRCARRKSSSAAWSSSRSPASTSSRTASSSM